MSLRTSVGAFALLVSTFAARSAHADAVIIDDHQNSGIQLVSHAESPAPQLTDIPASAWASPVPAGPAGAQAPHPGPNVYPRLNAPLYPCPVQYTPQWNGGAFITNQAFAPHEMTYPHRYHAMYPPFYHKVEGKWILTPFGMRQHEDWKLEGTEVMVNYRSRFKLFSGYHPPR
ncbi:MAG: hypothetical protein KDA75_19300 [Planctomycetaceae bacterium]|nr:hypothetical protein [Planctomycetaceae bacterium]